MFTAEGWQRVYGKLMQCAIGATWGRYQDAEDCVSEAVCRYMIRVKSGKVIDHPLWYLRHMIKNAARDKRRYAHNRSGPLYAVTVTEDPTTDIEERIDRAAQLEGLKPHQDYPFLINYYGDHKGQRPRADRVRATRARRRMRLEYGVNS